MNIYSILIFFANDTLGLRLGMESSDQEETIPLYRVKELALMVLVRNNPYFIFIIELCINVFVKLQIIFCAMR